MPKQWILQKKNDHEITVVTPDDVTVHDQPTLEELMWALSKEIVKRSQGGAVRCGVNCGVTG